MSTTTLSIKSKSRHLSHSVTSPIIWLSAWALVTTAVILVVSSQTQGSLPMTATLTAAAIAAFIGPDLTFLVELCGPAEKVLRPRKAVPYYNAARRLWALLTLTALAGTVAASHILGATALIVGLSWTAQIALDRVFRNGLRKADGSR